MRLPNLISVLSHNMYIRICIIHTYVMYVHACILTSQVCVFFFDAMVRYVHAVHIYIHMHVCENVNQSIPNQRLHIHSRT